LAKAFVDMSKSECGIEGNMKGITRSQGAMTGGWRASRGCDRGATLLEFALTISTFLVVLLAVMELGIMIYSYAVISAAAKEGVRYAIVVGSNASLNIGASNWTRIETTGCPFSTSAFTNTGDPTGPIQCKVWDYARYSLQVDPSGASGTNLTVNVTFQPSNDTTYCPAGTSPLWSVPCLVRVSVNYTYAPLFGIPLTPTMSAVAEGRMIN
jgi:Flp pilus assembly protein TadG